MGSPKGTCYFQYKSQAFYPIVRAFPSQYGFIWKIQYSQMKPPIFNFNQAFAFYQLNVGF